MKQDFSFTNEELNRKGIVAVCRDTYMHPKRRGANFFVKSPASTDKTWSLCLYPASNRYCDFCNGNRSGDIISFYSYTQGCNNWQALKELQAYYGLSSSSERNREEMQRKIWQQQERERRAAERKIAFRAALSGCIDDLREWAGIYRAAIERPLYEPFTDGWRFCVEELQRTNYKLDILCAADCKTYVRMKSNTELGLPSDRPQWLLDTLEILQGCGAFQATRAEMEEITAQRDFELIRQPGRDRRCCIDW